MKQSRKLLVLECGGVTVGCRVSYGDLSRSYVERGELTDISGKI